MLRNSSDVSEFAVLATLMEALLSLVADPPMRSFSTDSVATGDNKLYTHFIPRPPDFSYSPRTRNDLFKLNRIAGNPSGAGS